MLFGGCSWLCFVRCYALSDVVVWSVSFLVCCLLLVVEVWCWLAAIASCALSVACCLSFGDRWSMVRRVVLNCFVVFDAWRALLFDDVFPYVGSRLLLLFAAICCLLSAAVC